MDDFIDPSLPAEDRQVMRQVMSGLAAWQMNKVIFYDVAGSGRIFVNRRELQAKAFYYKQLTSSPETYAGPSGEMLAIPAVLPPPTHLSLEPATPPTKDSTGPFQRFWVDSTSWISEDVMPVTYPIDVLNRYPCDEYTIIGGDSGYAYAGAYAGVSNSAEAEFGVFIHTPGDPTKGFEQYMAYRPKGHSVKMPPQGYTGNWGCFQWMPNNLVFSVISPTLLCGTFKGYIDPRAPGGGLPDTVTQCESAYPSDGWNLNGSSELTFVNITVAQASSTKGYIPDGTHFAMQVGNGYGVAGTGTVSSPTTGCVLDNPLGYDVGQSGFCSGWAGVYLAAHPFPTPPPATIFVGRLGGGTGGELVGICLANAVCNPLPTFTTCPCPTKAP